jgi:hypothetical protein
LLPSSWFSSLFASAQQGGFTTPTDGPESAKLAASYDPTRATYITDADIEAAIKRLRPDGVSANGVFVERRGVDFGPRLSTSN